MIANPRRNKSIMKSVSLRYRRTISSYSKTIFWKTSSNLSPIWPLEFTSMSVSTHTLTQITTSSCANFPGRSPKAFTKNLYRVRKWTKTKQLWERWVMLQSTSDSTRPTPGKWRVTQSYWSIGIKRITRFWLWMRSRIIVFAYKNRRHF